MASTVLISACSRWRSCISSGLRSGTPSVKRAGRVSRPRLLGELRSSWETGVANMCRRRCCAAREDRGSQQARRAGRT
jgi:hypothetical protein